jgi:CcmD family protein
MQPLPSAAIPSAATPIATASPDARSSEFRAVEGGAEARSGTVLLVEAYAAIWLIIFGFIWLTFRRQRKLDSRIAELEIALQKARKETS